MADNAVQRPLRYRTRSYRVHPTAAHPSPHPPPVIRRLQNFRFEGQRRTFLLSKIGLFLEAIRRKELRLFWAPLFAEYWREFPWRLAITRDPHPRMLVDTTSSMLTDEEVDKRTLVMMTTEGLFSQKIKAWFHHEQNFDASSLGRLLERRTSNPIRGFQFVISVEAEMKLSWIHILTSDPPPVQTVVPLPMPKSVPKVLHSGSWWQDFHRNRREREARRNNPQPALRYEAPPVTEQGQIWTFVPTRSQPSVGTVQNDGRIVYTMPEPATGAALDFRPAPSSAHASGSGGYRSLRSAATQRAEARLRARPSEDEQLLARLQETPQERRRRQLEEQLRGTMKPLPKEQRRRKKAAAVKAAAVEACKTSRRFLLFVRGACELTGTFHAVSTL
ncbi:hypothetical protein B0H13DRAFT_1911453 [Mycena leptocephala]|nr:hypothetical protein B0H13DRAFT_1911453 [Mycena leptocephala]